MVVILWCCFEYVAPFVLVRCEQCTTVLVLQQNTSGVSVLSFACIIYLTAIIIASCATHKIFILNYHNFHTDCSTFLKNKKRWKTYKKTPTNIHSHVTND